MFRIEVLEFLSPQITPAISVLATKKTANLFNLVEKGLWILQ